MLQVKIIVLFQEYFSIVHADKTTHPNADKRQTHWTDHLPLHSDGRSLHQVLELAGTDHEPTTFDTITPVRSKETQWIIFPQNHSPPSTGSDTQEQHHRPIEPLFSLLFVCVFYCGFRRDSVRGLSSHLHPSTLSMNFLLKS